MHRRHVLHGLVAGIPLFAGCSALSGDDGGNGTDGNTTGNGTTATTNVAETVQETATRTATATETSVSTATATETATETPVSTATPTVSATASATAATTTPSTTGARPTEGTTTVETTPGAVSGALIDPSNLTMYASEAYPYSVKYPAGWMVDASDSTQVTFQSETGLGQEQVLVIEGMAGISLDTLVGLLNDGFEQAFDTYRTLSRQDVTLSNGTPAAVLDVTMSDSSFSGLTLRGKSVYTVADGIAYGVLVLVLSNAYTSTVEQAMTEIVTSLTIQNA